jgi:pimeloyl-ACP methyl ester carboxylesterase
MHIVDMGSGPPLVLIPGIQGRWEWMKPAVDALAARCRVITFSLIDEPSSGARCGRDEGFDCYVRQVDDALTQCGLHDAVVCGVSFGGVVAAAFAARHPERTSALVLVSAIPPGWRPDARARIYLLAPRLLAPLFMVASLRLVPEIVAAREGLLPGLATAAQHGITVLTHMFSPTRMAGRIAWFEAAQLGRSMGRIEAPTLVVTGEDALERVVPPALTRQYLTICPHAEAVTLKRTGHLGLITRADEFARVVTSFVERTAADTARRRRIV